MIDEATRGQASPKVLEQLTGELGDYDLELAEPHSPLFPHLTP